MSSDDNQGYKVSVLKMMAKWESEQRKFEFTHETIAELFFLVNSEINK